MTKQDEKKNPQIDEKLEAAAPENPHEPSQKGNDESQALSEEKLEKVNGGTYFHNTYFHEDMF